MNKIKTIISKEWAEVFKNRMVLFRSIFMPSDLCRHAVVHALHDARRRWHER